MTETVPEREAKREKFKVLSLFAGIGGFDLGLERTGGFRTVAFCEIEPFCQRVLAKHWPKVPIYDDIRELTGARLAADGIAVDVICGGFPCQDVSLAGKRVGLEGARSGLWSEYRRLISELLPVYVIVENVPGLLSNGMGTVLGELAEIGYDATWDCIPACAVGAPHRRDRVWIVAHPRSEGGRLQSRRRRGAHGADTADAEHDGQAQSMANADGAGRGIADVLQQRPRGVGGGSEALAHADSDEQHGRLCAVQVGRERSQGEAQDDGYAGGTQWSTEPDVGRVAHGVPSRVDRLRSLGNAVVPQIPKLIGKAILKAEGAR
jgi:DNA (cytosine-5)-methyltransferase 1